MAGMGLQTKPVDFAILGSSGEAFLFWDWLATKLGLELQTMDGNKINKRKEWWRRAAPGDQICLGLLQVPRKTCFPRPNPSHCILTSKTIYQTWSNHWLENINLFWLFQIQVDRQPRRGSAGSGRRREGRMRLEYTFEQPCCLFLCCKLTCQTGSFHIKPLHLCWHLNPTFNNSVATDTTKSPTDLRQLEKTWTDLEVDLNLASLWSFFSENGFRIPAGEQAFVSTLEKHTGAGRHWK